MGIWRRISRAGRALLEREGGESGAGELRDETEKDAPAASERPADEGARAARGLSSWVEERAERVVSRVYESRAEELEERATRAMQATYERAADDLEQRAVRAMRQALEAEAGKIQAAIEHAIAVKKREVRLSLLVLVVSSLVYLALHWFTAGAGSP